MNYYGDFTLNDTVIMYWGSNDANGASITPSVPGTISIYKDGGTTQITDGVTDSRDFDSITGVHKVEIDTSDVTTPGFFAAGSDYSIILTAATIDGQTVNICLGTFSIQNRYMRGTDSAITDISSLATLVELGNVETNLEGRLTTIDGKVDIVDTNVDTSLVNQATIEGKVDIVDTNVDTSLTNQTTMLANQTTIEGKVDIIDTNVDTALVEIGTLPADVWAFASRTLSTAGNTAVSSNLLGTTIDGSFDLEDVFQLVFCVLSGKTSDDGTKFYAADGLTTLFEVSIDANENRTIVKRTGV